MTDAPRFEILGSMRAWQGERELDLGPAKQRAVLGVLLVNANRPVPTARIVDAVWQDEPPENGANVVQKYVAGLRRVLEPDRSPRSPGNILTLTEAGYLLSVEPERLDAEIFQRYVRQAQAARTQGRLDDASALFQAALDLWRGTALAGLSGPPFDAFRDGLVEGRGAALEAWAEIELRRGRDGALVPRLVELVAEFPLREGLRYLLILALYRCGRQAEALAAYRDARALLAEEFGVEPGERLQQLHRGILRSDPALGVPVPGPAPVPTAGLNGHRPAVALAVPVARKFPGWLARTIAVLVPLLTFGLASWAMVGFHAVRQRSRTLGLAAAGYLALLVFFAAAIDGDRPGKNGTWADLAVMALLVSMVGGAVHGALIDPYAHSSPARLSLEARVAQRVRREQARQIASRYPTVARELGIGRPDLPRTFDDGGLVDVNSAPEIVLASLPGIGPEDARRIVADRFARGTLASLDDLVTRRLVPHQVARNLADTLVVLPPG